MDFQHTHYSEEGNMAFFKRGLRQNNLVYCMLSEMELAVIFKNEYSLEANKYSLLLMARTSTSKVKLAGSKR